MRDALFENRNREKFPVQFQEWTHARAFLSQHSSGQARVTINGKDFLLGLYGGPESKEAYGRMIAKYGASGGSLSFGKTPDRLKMEDVLLAYIKHAKEYCKGSTECINMKIVAKPLTELYGNHPACKFGAAEFKAIRAWWMAKKIKPAKSKADEPPRLCTRQYINKCMKRTLRIVKWAVSSGMMPAENYTAIRCGETLTAGRCSAPESDPITCVAQSLVEATRLYLTKVVADMVRLQRQTGCRPGEFCSIKKRMVDRTTDVWTIGLAKHKTAHKGKLRTIYIGPQAQVILAPYLLRADDAYCFSPLESEKQRREAQHEATDPADYYMYYVAHQDEPKPLQPEELKHRLARMNDQGDIVEEWGWHSVTPDQHEITALTMYFLEDLFSEDRDELIAQVKDLPSGLDWLATLFGLVQGQLNGPIWHDDGTVGTKFDDAKIVEELTPICFYFDAIAKVAQPRTTSEPSRKISQAMILRRLKLRYSAKEQVARARSTISTWVKRDDFPKCMTWSKVRQWILDNKHVDIGEP